MSEIGAEYASSLADLTVNSKPLINMLTILAEENQQHANDIVNAVETHLEKVRPDIKLPVLYLVDSIIKNVGGAYTQRFSQSIVNMFTKTFKQVDEKTRSQMFKLRETWNDVFPANKLYQLDVKVSLIDPAWPIQAQVPLKQATVAAPVIHLNPHFQKKPGLASSGPGVTVPVVVPVTIPAAESEEDMALLLARKQQELLLLQQKKEQLEAARRLGAGKLDVPAVTPHSTVPMHEVPSKGSVQARLGPPVARQSSGARIAPVSSTMLASARRDPRLARLQAASTAHAARPPQPPPPPAPDVFDIKPLDRSERVIKRKNAITIDVNAESKSDHKLKDRDPRRRDPRMKKRLRDFERRDERKRDDKNKTEPEPGPTLSFPVLDPERVNKLPPIPKIKKPPATIEPVEPEASPSKRKKEPSESHRQKRARRKESSSSPEKPEKRGDKENKRQRESEPLVEEAAAKPAKDAETIEPELPAPTEEEEEGDRVTFKERKSWSRDRHYMRRNKEKSESPEPPPALPTVHVSTVPDMLIDDNKDVDLRVLMAGRVDRKRPSTEAHDSEYAKKKTMEKFDMLFGGEDVDLRMLPPNVDAAPAPPIISRMDEDERYKKDEDERVNNRQERESDKQEKESQKESSTLEKESKSPERSEKVSRNSLKDCNNSEKELNQSDDSMDSLKDSKQTENKLVRLEEDNKDKETKTSINEEDKDERENNLDQSEENVSPGASPRRKSWAKIKEPKKSSVDAKHQLDLVRAKLAEATKGKDRLGRPLLYNNDDTPRERARSISTSEDTDMRYAGVETDTNDKETFKIIMSQAEEQLKGGNLNPEQFNLLVMQVLQLNERQKLKEAKQRESLEVSKRKLHELAGRGVEKNHVTYGDIDDRVMLRNSNRDADANHAQNNMPGTMDSDVRVPPTGHYSDNHIPEQPYPYNQYPRPPYGAAPMRGRFPVGPRPRDEYVPQRGMRPRGQQPFFRGRMPFDRPSRPNVRMQMPPPPMKGVHQGEYPGRPYVRSASPPPLGTVDSELPPTDMRIVEYIDRDPMKTIDIDGCPREIRFYGRTAIVMLDWDDPREITFLSGRRRISFDNNEAYMLNFNEDDVKVTVGGRIMKIGYGKPTRELYIDDQWYECFFGGPSTPVVVNDTVTFVHLSGPPPKVDIGKMRRTDLCAGKINLIIDAVIMCPIFLDAKPQKVEFEGRVLTVRFVDALRTVLINEVPFAVEYGGLPKPIVIDRCKHFVRFSVLPKSVRAGEMHIVGMEGRAAALLPLPAMPPVLPERDGAVNVESNDDGENSNQGGLDMDRLASLMPSTMAPASQFSQYSVAAEPPALSSGSIPGLETPKDENPAPTTPFFGINVNDLFAKLVATGIVPAAKTEDKKEEETKEEEKKEEKKLTSPVMQDAKIKQVDLLKPETLRVKQAGIVSLLYSGMQCSGCGARFPPEQTVKYSQHLDWHFRQNRRERDSARRAHSRNWHYDLSDWIQYEEIEDLEEREKSWFESQGAADSEASEAPATAAREHDALSVAAGAPCDAACALCGDKFDQFYNQDKEEWHLRKAVRHEENNYHPLCFEDYKASLNKPEEPAPDDSVIEVSVTESRDEEMAAEPPANKSDPEVEVISLDEEIVIIDAESQGGESEEISQDSQDTRPTEQSTEGEENPTVVSDEEKKAEEPPAEPEPESDDDDVVLQQEPVEQVDLDVDYDTDDETQAARAKRDLEFDFTKVKIKQEPIDPDDEPVVTATESAPAAAAADTTHAVFTSTIDGNTELGAAASSARPAAAIRINIAKPVAAAPSPPRDNALIEDMDEPLPPGEEPPIEYKLKPTLEGVEFSRQPPTQKGIELSGLCSIM